MAKVPIDKLGKALTDIIEKYEDDMVNCMNDVVREAGRKTAAAVRTSARNVVKGPKYPSSWTFTVEGRVSPKAVIYSKVPGLPHLIENGHATRKGGRVAGKPHIKPAEEVAVAEFVREMQKRLEVL